MVRTCVKTKPLNNGNRRGVKHKTSDTSQTPQHPIFKVICVCDERKKSVGILKIESSYNSVTQVLSAKTIYVKI